jgi:membrane associated rhomboid family serine protease
MYAQHSPLEEIKSFFKQRSLLSNLILINIGVFVFVNFINLILWLFQSGDINGGRSFITNWFALPSNISELFLKPWTLLSYMFLQENFFHLLFNMIMLYFSGRIFSEYLSQRKLLSVYIWGGLIGGLLYVIAYNTFPVFADAARISVPMLGSSASVLAILFAIATYVPNYNVPLILIGRVKLKHLAIVFIIVDVLSIQRGNAGGHIAHIGGALWGFAYIWLVKNNYTMKWGRFKFPKISFRNGPRKAYSNPNYKRPVTDDEYNKRKNQQQKEVDLILEKISKSGYSSLTKKEKELLFKSSNKK